ncbi:EAL domain-containing protein [Phreatobacter aquaticus]|uniref:EAL domain-containing protein n=2 Tax=Phreatobacter aquaticus TaxID=2570229 RepID=A0A4D7QY50_9HYPH|nr:EAL domain-containing protein [Phreatobacter aquaticus]
MGYWRSIERTSPDLWLSPELVAIYDLEPGSAHVAMTRIRSRYLGDAPDRLKAAYYHCWDTGEPYVVEGDYRGAEDRVLTFAVYGEAERDAAGVITGVSGIVKDVTDERRALTRLAASQASLTDFVDTASDWCWETDTEHRFVDLSLKEHWTRSPGRRNFSSRTRRDMPIIPEDRAKMDEHFQDLEARRPFKDFVYSYLDPSKEGGRVSVRSSGKPIFDANGAFLGYRGTASDITQLRQAEELLNQRTAALREAHRMGKIGTWSYRLGSERVTLADECITLFGLEAATFDPTHANVLACFGASAAEQVIKLQREAIRSRTTQAIDVQVVRPDGSSADLALTCEPELDAAGEAIGIIGTVQDITERKEAQRQLEKLAYHDPLTGLANRALFKRELATVLDACFRKGTSGALLLLDLDRFKEVNDSLGHAAGDELLSKVGVLLRAELGRNAFIARLGGDEFAVLPDPTTGADDVEMLAARIVDRLCGPIQLSEGEAFIGATIGIAHLPIDGTTVDEAMRNADLALYMAKEAGRGRAMVFEPAYAQAVEQRLDLARHLRHAVEAGTLHAHYQPQVDLSSHKVTGFEALLRWNHPERGPIPPNEFIPIAESSGLIVDLGLWILREACTQARAWIDQGFKPRSVAVNVSPAQFWNMDFETAVSAVLAETGLPPHLLCLELTESLFVDHTEHRISRTLTALSALGVRLALDDFGSGYSSLGYLTRLPFDRLKVDRSFVDGISTRPEKRKLLGGIIALSRGLGMSVVAEGAELQAEVDVLADLDCDCVQGYVFSRPVPPETAPLIADAIERRFQTISPSLAPDDEAAFAAAPIGV